MRLSMIIFNQLTYARQVQNTRDVESTLPEPLREQVLRRVQFSPITRFEQLGTSIFFM